MQEYKDVLIGYVNDSKNGKGKYLSIKNVSKEPIVIEPEQYIYLNITPKAVREKYPKMPWVKKSVKVEHQEIIN